MKRVVGFIATGALITGIAAGGAWFAVNEMDQKPVATNSQSQPATNSKEEGEGSPIEVYPYLRQQGFPTHQIAIMDTNKHYILMPFVNSKEITGVRTCQFSMTHADYILSGKHPRIMSRSRVLLRAVYLNEAANPVGYAPGSHTIELSKVTPEYLAAHTGIDLSGCGDTVLKK
ncbi:MAG: hypothetical protein HZB75_05150 [Candidatus Saccharibacteria bacterium]|jgi:hypothetical protein|nr:MAG: hypothetical protein HZB75_05150 [Candidatus Saccharibacteria bacterium]